MFLGHFGLAFAAKKINKAPSLGTTFLAAQFIDLLWPFFLIFGIEQVEIDPGNTAFTPLNFVSYPFTHSLVAVVIWGIIVGLMYLSMRKDKKSAIMLGLLVVSHWFLDAVVHRPDLPVSFGDATKVGLGLWNNVTATLVVELFIFVAGILLYITSTRAQNKWGNISLYSLLIFFLAIYFMNAFGNPPPDAQSIGYVGLAQWLLVAWGYWTDANRISKDYNPKLKKGLE